MKKILSYVLVLAMLMTGIVCFSVEAVAAENVIYLSDNGDDTNDGLTQTTPVKTIKKAISLLGGASATGTVKIVDIYTYLSTDAYRFDQMAALTVEGVTQDSVFVMNRSAGLTCYGKTTYQNLTIKSKYSFFTGVYALTFQNTVKTVPYDGTSTTDRTQYPALNIGQNGDSNGATLAVYGGTFYYCVIGLKDKLLKSKATFILGQNARLMGSLQAGGSPSYSEIAITIYGTIDSGISFYNTGVNTGNSTTYAGNISIIAKNTANFKSISYLDKVKASLANSCTLTVDCSENSYVSRSVKDSVKAQGFTMTEGYFDNNPVYLADTGVDTNSGKTADAPVKTLAQAVELLGRSLADGTIVIVNKYTYNDGWQAPTAKNLVITGNTQDAVFYLARTGGLTLYSNVKFTNVTYQSCRNLYAGDYNLEIAEDVKVIPTTEYSGSKDEERNHYPVVYAGSGSNSKGGIITLNAGSYNYCYAGGNAKTISTDVTFNIGKNVHVYTTLYVDSAADFAGNITLNIDGKLDTGVRFKSVTTATEYYKGNIYLNVGENANIGNLVYLSGVQNAFASGKKLIVDLRRNKALSTKLSSTLTTNGATVYSYIEDAPVFTGIQTKANGSNYDIRLISTIDAITYEDIGYNVTAEFTGGKKQMDIDCDHVYTSINSYETGTISAESLGGDYIFALNITNIPTSVGTVTFTIVPYSIKNGTPINGCTSKFTVTYASDVFTVTAIH